MNQTEGVPSGEVKWCTIMPLIQFDAEWAASRYDFDYGVTVARAGTELRRAIDRAADQPGEGLGPGYPFDWVLITRFRWVVTANFPTDTGGAEPEMQEWKTLHDAHWAIAESFILALNLMRLTPALVASAVEAHLRFAEGGVEILETGQLYSTYDTDALVLSPVYGPSALPGFERRPCYGDGVAFDHSELQVLAAIWPRVAKLNHLPGLAEDVAPEDFGVFYGHQVRDAASTTRLGRAMKCFGSGIYLPRTPAFLLMCLALENLYTTDNTALADKIATRLALIVGSDEDYNGRVELFRDAKELYEQRNRIVHGKGLLPSDDPFLPRAILLAQRSLQRILGDARLYSLFADEDRVNQCEKRLGDFYKVLSLGSPRDVAAFLERLGVDGQ